MIAVVFDRFGGPEVLHLAEVPDPEVLPNTVLIRVEAAGVAPVDLSVRAGTSPSAGGMTFPHIPGVDAAGVVVAVGAGVSDVAPGDELYGIVDVRSLGGATAELAVLHTWAPRAAEMPWAEAGAAGTSVETATRVLDLLDARPGQTLLVTGAAGGVGSIAVQLAAARDLRVIGTTRAETADLVESLGATPLVVDGDLGEALRDATITADLAFATVGGALPGLIALTGSADRVVTIADYAAADVGARFTGGTLMGEPDGAHGLSTASELAAQGRFRIPLRAVHVAADAAAAHADAERRPRWGKVAITGPFA